MLTLPEFELVRPSSIVEAVNTLAAANGRARLLAGGTDLLVNMKHGLVEPDVLVDLSAVSELRGVTLAQDGALVIGAMERIADLVDHPLICDRFPSLHEALSQIAGPQLRNMGTIGGNVCLDTRCVYVNQTHFWRSSLGYCLKKDGAACHVVTGGKRCVAAQSSDSVPVLISLDARVHLVHLNNDGELTTRVVPVEALFRRDGVAHLALSSDDLLVQIEIPPPRKNLRTAYQKLRVRKAIDFPALSLALAVSFAEAESTEIAHLALVATALMAAPRRLAKVDQWIGQKLTVEVIDALATQAYKQFVPLTNILVDPAWRREMVPVLVRRAFGRVQGLE